MSDREHSSSLGIVPALYLSANKHSTKSVEWIIHANHTSPAAHCQRERTDTFRRYSLIYSVPSLSCLIIHVGVEMVTFSVRCDFYSPFLCAVAKVAFRTMWSKRSRWAEEKLTNIHQLSQSWRSGGSGWTAFSFILMCEVWSSRITVAYEWCNKVGYISVWLSISLTKYVVPYDPDFHDQMRYR